MSFLKLDKKRMLFLTLGRRVYLIREFLKSFMAKKTIFGRMPIEHQA